MGNENINSVETTVRLSKFEVINSEFTRARCNVFYTGRNRNFSDITEEALNKFIARKGYANVPVVAHLMKRDDGTYYIGGHDAELRISNQAIELIDQTVPFGVIPEDCNPGMDSVTEKSGEVRDYFSVDIILWTHRYPILEAAYSDEIYFNQSMELRFLDYYYDDSDYVVVNDFSMSALCLLNKSMNSNENVEPCFESSTVKKFSLDDNNFKAEFELLLDKIKQFQEEKVPEKKDKKNSDPTPEKGDYDMDLSKFTEILSAVTIEGKDTPKYILLNADENNVYVLDVEDYKPYGFDYAFTKDGDTENLIIDYESKAEKSLSATDKIESEGFTEFSIKDAIDNGVSSGIDAKMDEYTVALNAKFDELQAEFDKLVGEYDVATKKLADYEAAEEENRKLAHNEAISKIFEKYSEKLSRCSEFLVLKAKTDPAEITEDELEQKLALMFGRYAMNNGTVDFSYHPIDSGINDKPKNKTDRYGNLLDPYL